LKVFEISKGNLKHEKTLFIKFYMNIEVKNIGSSPKELVNIANNSIIILDLSVYAFFLAPFPSIPFPRKGQGKPETLHISCTLWGKDARRTGRG